MFNIHEVNNNKQVVLVEMDIKTLTALVSSWGSSRESERRRMLIESWEIDEKIAQFICNTNFKDYDNAKQTAIRIIRSMTEEDFNG